ncbi:hypothetical protein COLO4_18434 [Corchorus olitorius]|uniref:Dirigent protein n=1 Tax=Corchorus olitorius TaxID=93759 RepID=A0A1R3J943_9ROSI|nr:hypothetical protein COLO4_18434 [Corchorus olitorius]
MAMKYVHGARLATNPSPSPSPLAATRLLFFMHDIFGGSAPSVRVVAGNNIVATNNQVTNNVIPFSKPNGGIFPKSHGVPLITPNNGLNVGGTGKYENAQGFALIETLHHTNQHTTDGIDTVLQFSVFLTN